MINLIKHEKREYFCDFVNTGSSSPKVKKETKIDSKDEIISSLTFQNEHLKEVILKNKRKNRGIKSRILSENRTKNNKIITLEIQKKNLELELQKLKDKMNSNDYKSKTVFF